MGELRNLIDDWYTKYGKYINKNRAFCSVYDGLKLVERRILISLSIEAKSKFTKSARIAGHCIGNLHPHCLSGDTKIPLIDGTTPTIQWLAENKSNEIFHVFSCDEETGKIVIGTARNPRIGQLSDTLYKITLDNNEIVCCTGNHPFMTRWKRDKRYKTADKLKVGDSLRPFISTIRQYEGGKPYKCVRSTYSPLKSVHEIVGLQFHGIRKSNEVYHHKNFNTLDNSIDNIIKLNRSQHAAIHYKDDKEFKATTLDDLKNKSQVNHVVTNIEVIKLDKPMQFYDITVDDYSNFAIDQGIFVHNSDASAYGTLVQLANNGMCDKQGNFGTFVGTKDDGSAPAAAARYTEVRMNQEIYNEAFELLKYVKEEDFEMSPEPIYLPTSLPFCLRMKNYSQGIGFGYKAYIPCYKKEDLIKRLDWLLHDKTGDGPIIKPITDCVLNSTTEDYKQLLTVGKATISLKGKLELDKTNKCVYVYSIPPNKKFKTVINAFKDEIQVQKSIGYLDESTTSTKVKFMLTKRGQDLNKLYKKLQQKTSGSITFICNMSDYEGNVVLTSVDQMLLNTYNMYKLVNETMLKDKISKLENDIKELIMIQKIKKVLPELLKLYPDDLDKLVEGITSKTDVIEEDCRKILEKYTIHRFMKVKIDIDGKTNELNTEKNNLQNIDTYVWNKY